MQRDVGSQWTSGLGLQQLRRPDAQIICQTFQISVANDSPVSAQGKIQQVTDRNEFKNGFQQVITVLASADNMQKTVDFGRSREIEEHRVSGIHARAFCQ